MIYVYAAMLLHKAGKPVDEENLAKVVGAAGVNPDPVRVKALVASLADVDIDEAIKSSPTFSTVTTAPAPTLVPAKETKPVDEKKKEEDQKKKEEAAIEGLGALFA